MDRGSCILYQKDSSAPLLNPSRDRNNTGCEYVTFINNIKKFQRSEVPFPFGILVDLKKLQQGHKIIQNLKNEKAKWNKNCALEVSV